MRNFLPQLKLSYLGVSENSDYLAVILDTIKFSLNILRSFRIFLGIFRESLSFGPIPILVKSAFDVITQMACPNSCQRAKAIRSLDVTHNADDNKRAKTFRVTQK